MLFKAVILSAILFAAVGALHQGEIPIDREVLKPVGGFVLIIIYGWLLLLLSLRVIHLIIGIGDMDWIDIVGSIFVTVAWVALPVSILVGLARLKLGKG